MKVVSVSMIRRLRRCVRRMKSWLTLLSMDLDDFIPDAIQPDTIEHGRVVARFDPASLARGFLELQTLYGYEANEAGRQKWLASDKKLPPRTWVGRLLAKAVQ